MEAFLYEGGPDPIRSDLVRAYREAWVHISKPGTWLTGAERVAVADETRRARNCELCSERKAALSPHSVQGTHDHAGILPAPMVDEVHRVRTDPARLTQSWYESLLADGLTADAYVEALGIAVQTISIDDFNHALGLPLEPLPTPVAGEPTRVRPQRVVEGEAWVPLQSASDVADQAGLPGGRAPFVIRALSLVPEEMKAWQRIGDAQYLGSKNMMRFDRVRAISRSQIELVAGRVSALNECFY